MSHRIVISTLLLAMLGAGAGCQLHPHPNELGDQPLPPAPTPALPYHISDMRVQSLPPETYLYAATRTSFDDIAGPASQTIPALRQLIASGAVHPISASPVLFIYHDPSEVLSTPFDLEIGLPLSDAPASIPEGFSVRTLPSFRCATVIYRGPMKLLPKAYDKLIPEMIAAGLVPSDETRESYRTWESPDSPGNVVQLQVGIRGKVK